MIMNGWCFSVKRFGFLSNRFLLLLNAIIEIAICWWLTAIEFLKFKCTVGSEMHLSFENLKAAHECKYKSGAVDGLACRSQLYFVMERFCRGLKPNFMCFVIIWGDFHPTMQMVGCLKRIFGVLNKGEII